MKDTVKFAVFLVIIVLVSVITTYITNLALDAHEGTQGTPEPSSSPQNTNEPSNNKIFPSFEVYLDPQPSGSRVTVTSGVSIQDLTIVYEYTSLNGTAYTEEIHYGDYYPTWSPNHVIEPGETQFQFYRIPQSIISACSSAKPKYDSDGDLIGYEWEIYPKLTVNVYGYS